MKESVKIDSLELENVKRVRAVELRPDRDGLTVIGGRNGQGKSSVLDAITWALGGERYRPDEPNRRGAAGPARVRVEMSNGLVAERRGKTGALHVTDESGRRAGQQLLNEFVSQLALDLPRFMRGSDAEKATALLHTLGIDDQLAALDGQIRGTYEDRQLAGRDAKAKRAHAGQLPRHDDAPEEPVSVAELVREQQGILARNGERQRKRDRAEQLRQAVEADHREQDAARRAVDDATRRVAEARARLEEANAKAARDAADLGDAEKTAEQLVDESTAEIEASITSVEETNAKVRDNQAARAAADEAARAEAEYDALTDRLEGLRDQRRSLLDGAPLPLDGLSIDEDGRLTYLGHTWGDMSGSEQLRVATAIVRAAKPDCGFVLVDELEQMDPQTLADFGAWAAAEGLQVIGTRVATDDTCTVVIEDGRVAGVGPEPGQGPEAGDEAEPRWKEL
ncbi:MAG: AAA family ATPase [Coriobacteriaceae bacterium]|nr:AAA family ATPase [Coriobacteriaceae bacterium]MCI7439027.1 AAA family ATPase [Coriobacteriaceae bacterium]